MTDQTPVETAAEALTDLHYGHQDEEGYRELIEADVFKKDAEVVLASLAQCRDDMARAIHARICEESIEDCLDPVWQGRCARAADAMLAFLTGGAR